MKFDEILISFRVGSIVKHIKISSDFMWLKLKILVWNLLVWYHSSPLPQPGHWYFSVGSTAVRSRVPYLPRQGVVYRQVRVVNTRLAEPELYLVKVGIWIWIRVLKMFRIWILIDGGWVESTQFLFTKKLSHRPLDPPVNS